MSNTCKKRVESATIETIKKYRGTNKFTTREEAEDISSKINHLWPKMTFTIANKDSFSVVVDTKVFKQVIKDRVTKMLEAEAALNKNKTLNQLKLNIIDEKVPLTNIEPQVENPTELSQYIGYSGNAEGADYWWNTEGKLFGIGRFVNYLPTTLDQITNPVNQQEIDEAYKKAALFLNRPIYSYNWKIPSKEQYKGALVRRNYLQAKAADAVFAIGQILQPEDIADGYKNTTNKSVISGGTAYAVEMAINMNKPVYVFDQIIDQWFVWDPINNKYNETTTPILTPKFAGIGTRQINEKGRQAIKDVYNKTKEFLNPTTITENTIEIPQIETKSTQENPLKVYVDGSDFKGTGQIGFGVYTNYNDTDHYITGAFDLKDLSLLEKDLGMTIDIPISNVIMEMYGSLVAIRNTPPNEYLHIHQDLEAVQFQIVSGLLQKIAGINFPITKTGKEQYSKWWRELDPAIKEQYFNKLNQIVALDPNILEKSRMINHEDREGKNNSIYTRGQISQNPVTKVIITKLVDLLWERPGKVTYSWLRGHSESAVDNFKKKIKDLPVAVQLVKLKENFPNIELGNDLVDIVAKDRQMMNTYNSLFKPSVDWRTTDNNSEDPFNC